MAAHAADTDLHARTEKDVLINHYLLPKIIADEGHNYVSFPYIHEANVYSKPPHQLVADYAPAPVVTGYPAKRRVWYFFSRLCYRSDSHVRRSRTVAGAADGMTMRWRSETGRKKVDDTAGGCLTKLSYEVKTASGWERLGRWVMAEHSFGIDNDHVHDTVLCKVYDMSEKDSGAGQQTCRSRPRRRDDAASGSSQGTTLGGEPHQLPHGAEDHDNPELLRLEELLMNDDDDDDDDGGGATTFQAPHGMDMNAAFDWSYYYLPGGGVVGGDGHSMEPLQQAAETIFFSNSNDDAAALFAIPYVETTNDLFHVLGHGDEQHEAAPPPPFAATAVSSVVHGDDGPWWEEGWNTVIGAGGQQSGVPAQHGALPPPSAFDAATQWFPEQGGFSAIDDTASTTTMAWPAAPSWWFGFPPPAP